MFKTREEKKQLAVNKADECKKNSKELRDKLSGAIDVLEHAVLRAIATGDIETFNKASEQLKKANALWKKYFQNENILIKEGKKAIKYSEPSWLSKKLDMILNAWFMATLNINKKEA